MSRKEFLGIPVQWKPERILQTMWNPCDNDLFPPKAFGIGCSINFHAVARSLEFIGKKRR